MPLVGSAHRVAAAEEHALGLLRLRAREAGDPLRFGATSDRGRGLGNLVTVLVAWDDGSALGDAELTSWRAEASQVGGRVGYGVEVVTGSRDEALDPDTPAERLALLATVFRAEVRQNPAIPLLRLTHPSLFADVPE